MTDKLNVLTVLGRGGFGAVSLVRQGGQLVSPVSMSRSVGQTLLNWSRFASRGPQFAVKTVSGDKHTAARVYAAAEARLLGRLCHCHVVQMHSFVQHPCESMLFMEYCEGGDLHTFIHSSG